MNILIAYFSRPGENLVNFEKKVLDKGNTEVLADRIRKELMTSGEDDIKVFRIVPKEPYSDNYDETYKRSLKELDEGLPVDVLHDIDESVWKDFDVVLLGFPIWHRMLPRCVSRFVKGHNWLGKTVYPFCTTEQGSFGVSESELRSIVRGGVIKNGMSILGKDLDVPYVEDRIKAFCNGMK